MCVPPHMKKTLAEATEIAVDCEQKDNSHHCCVGVTQLSFIVPTLCDSFFERGAERSCYKVHKPVRFSLSIFRLELLFRYLPHRAASHTAPSKSGRL